jgi:hypothetical protein
MKKLFSTIVMFVVLVMASAATVSAICENDGIFPSPDDCAKYINCQDGVAHELTCPAGLLFNPVTSTCDWAENVECAGGSKQCYKNPNDGKNDGNCYLRQDSNGSGNYIQVCEQASFKPKPCETGASS